MAKKVALIGIILVIAAGVFFMMMRRSHMMGAGSQVSAGGLVAVFSSGAPIPVPAATGKLPANTAQQASGDLLVSLSLTPYPPSGGDASTFVVTLVDASGLGWTCFGPGLSDANNVRCVYNAPLAPGGGPLVITVVVQVGPNIGPVIVNTAVVSTAGDLNSSNNTWTHVDRRDPTAAPALSEAGLLLLIAALLAVAFFTMRSGLGAESQ